MAADGEYCVNQNLLYEINAVMPAALNTELFVSLCTIQSPDAVINPDGTTTGTGSNTFSDVAGLVNIPCMDSVPSVMRVQATEVKDLEEIMSKAYRHVLLNDFYEVLNTAAGLGWRAIVDGVTYDLLGGEPDSQGQMTRLELQLVTV